MKKLAFTTAIALALGTAAYAAGPEHSNNMGPPSGFSGGSAPGGGFKGPGAASTFSQPSGRLSNMSPGKGLYNQGQPNIRSNSQGYKPGGNKPYGPQGFNQHGNPTLFNKYGDGKYGEGKYGEGKYGEGKYGEHEGKYGEHEGKYGDHDHHGVVSGNFYEHGRHFRFRRFFHGEWVFLNDWDDCTAWVWVHVAPATWVWRPVDICIG